MLFASVNEIKSAALADHEAGEEIAPGVVIRRRRILKLGFGIAAIGVLGGVGGYLTSSKRRPIDGQHSPEMPWTFNQVLAAIRPMARELVDSDVPDEEAYLRAVALLLTRLNPASQPTRNWYEPSPGILANVLGQLPPIVLFNIRLAPGTKIQLHDHRFFNSVVLVTKGTTRIRHFDIVQPEGKVLNIARGEVPEQGVEFLIRQSKDLKLGRSEITSLSRDRDNIHHVEAGPDGCELIDLFTHFRPEAMSHELAWDDKPWDPKRGLYKVAWS